MGYTHSWTQMRSFRPDEWDEVRVDITAILTHVEHGADTVLGDWEGNLGSRPIIDAREIMFNGVGDNAHETFSINRIITRGNGSDCCKTARKPYDLAVTACLCYLSSVIETHDVGSDGHGHDFLAGLAAAREALPEKANMLDIPIGVMRDDRWTGPWISGQQGSGYHVGFCINGKGYVTHKKSKEVYCFETHGEMAKFLNDNKIATFRKGGRTVFGGYGLTEPDIWHASGSFDQLRHTRIARAQARILAKLFPVVDLKHDQKPPAYVRPQEYVRPEDNGTFSYDLCDLLQKISAIGEVDAIR